MLRRRAIAAGSLTPPQHLVYQPDSLVWNAVPGAEYYLVAQADTRTGPYRTFPAKHLSTNAALSGLTLSTHYYFVVYAAAKEGLSPASDPVDVFAVSKAKTPVPATVLLSLFSCSRTAAAFQKALTVIKRQL